MRSEVTTPNSVLIEHSSLFQPLFLLILLIPLLLTNELDIPIDVRKMT